MPPTIQALLAARLDQLEPSERGVLERGSVEGRVFHRGAVQALAPEEPQVTELPHQPRAQGAGPPGHAAASRRGRLPLPSPADPRRRLRGAAEGDPRRAARALRRLAGRARADLVELDEILGYHLEQAHRYRVGARTARTNEGSQLGAPRGGATAGRGTTGGRRPRGHGRGREPARAGERASARETTPIGCDAQPDLASALIETGALARAERCPAGGDRERARRTADERIEARALLALAYLRLQTDPALAMEGVRAETERLIAVFERLGDDRGLARAWRELGKVRMWLGRCEAGTEALRALARPSPSAPATGGSDGAPSSGSSSA